MKKRVSEKGPYQVFTIDRSAPIVTGHYSMLDNWDLAPDFPSKEFPESTSLATQLAKRKKHGFFSKLDRFQKKPTDRISIEHPGRQLPTKLTIAERKFLFASKVWNRRTSLSQAQALTPQSVNGKNMIFIRKKCPSTSQHPEMTNARLRIRVA